MMECSDGTDIETTNNHAYKEEISTNSSLFGISDEKVLSGEVIKKRRKEITLKGTSNLLSPNGEI